MTISGARKNIAVKSPSAPAPCASSFTSPYWLVRTYGRGAKPPADAVFRIEVLPRVTQVAASTLAQLQEASLAAATLRERAATHKYLERADNLPPPMLSLNR
jgi:hypothetical protein